MSEEITDPIDTNIDLDPETLDRQLPTCKVSASRIPFNNTAELLTPDMLLQRNLSLARIAAKGSILPSSIKVN